jgi:hypothetical protein
MKGLFVCVYAEYMKRDPEVFPANEAAKRDHGPPKVTDISKSYMPIQMAERVVFIGADGSIWLMKDRYETGKFPKRIRAQAGGKAAAKDWGFAADLAANFRSTPYHEQLIKDGLMRDPRKP